jgi:hypothetical protein
MRLLRGHSWLGYKHIVWPWVQAGQIQTSKRAVQGFAHRGIDSRLVANSDLIWHCTRAAFALPKATRFRFARMSSLSATIDTADTYRLPTNVRPTHYEVTVRTDLEKLVFDGFVRVQ